MEEREGGGVQAFAHCCCKIAKQRWYQYIKAEA